MRSCFVAILALSAAACASTPVVAPAAPTLAYALPAVNPARYLVADTTRILVDAPGERTVETMIALRTQALLGVHVDSAGLLASVRLDSLSGAFVVGQEASMVLDSADAPQDALLLRLAAGGADTLIAAPVFTRELTRIIGGPSFANHLFVPLPGAAVPVGTAWTDTLTLTEEDAGVRSTTTAIISSVLQGDTVIDGHTLQVIASSIATAIDVSGVVDNLDVSQELTGTSTALTLWDDTRSLLFRREETGSAAGTMDLPGLGVSGVPVRASMRRTVELLP